MDGLVVVEYSHGQESCHLRTVEEMLGVRRETDLPSVLDPLAGAMERLGYPSRDVFAVRLGMEEALVNALKHGNRGDPAKRARVRYRVSADEVWAEVEDEGEGFDPARVPDPLGAEGLSRPGGRGLLLMRRFLDSARYNGKGNAVTLFKKRSRPAAESR